MTSVPQYNTYGNRPPISVTHPEVASQWHPTLNGNLTADRVTQGSHKKIWWLGPCGHEWESEIAHRIYERSGCPYCSGRYPIPGETDLATLYPAVAAAWHPTLNGDLLPEDLTRGSHREAWWLCPEGTLELPHAYRAVVYSQTLGNNGCPYCANCLVLIGDNDLATTDPELAAQWHPDNDKTTTEVTRGSGYRAKWVCPKNSKHVWTAIVAVRSVYTTGCPKCFNRVSRPETLVAEFVKSLLPDTEVRQSDRTVIKFERSLELDIYIPSLQKAIEYNGTWFHGPEMRPNDWDTHRELKSRLCLEKGIELLHVEGDDYLENPEGTLQIIRGFLAV